MALAQPRVERPAHDYIADKIDTYYRPDDNTVLVILSMDRSLITMSIVLNAEDAHRMAADIINTVSKEI